MDILTSGHIYALDAYDGDCPQTLIFLQRTGPGYPGNTTAHAGTNCQEVLRALIARTQYLLAQTPCAETEAILGLLQSALLLFELRAARRHGRHLTLETLAACTTTAPCPTCGHLGCTGSHYEGDPHA